MTLEDLYKDAYTYADLKDLVNKAYQLGRVDMITEVIDETNTEEADERCMDNPEEELFRFGDWLGETKYNEKKKLKAL